MKIKLFEIFYLIPAVLTSSALGISVSERCGSALGMEDGRIKDYQLTASSSYQPSLVGPNNARLNTESGGGAWCPKSQIENTMETSEFLQIDLISDHIISSVLIQGRYGNGLGQEYTEYFAIEYRSSIDQQYMRYTDHNGVSVLPANINTFQVTQYNLTKIVVADIVRIFPLSEYPRTVCIRVELTGCPYSGNLLSMLMEASGGVEDLQILYPQSRSEESSVQLYLAVAIGIFVTVICASIAAVAIALYRSRVQSRKAFTSQYNFVSSSERDSSIPSDPSSVNGHVTLIANTSDYVYGQARQALTAGVTATNHSNSNSGSTISPGGSSTSHQHVTPLSSLGDGSYGGGSANGQHHVTHLPPSGSGLLQQAPQPQQQQQQQQSLTGNFQRTRSRSVRPRLVVGGSNYVRRASLDERGSGGSVSSARSAESVTRPVENTERGPLKSSRRHKEGKTRTRNGFKDKGDVIRFPLQQAIHKTNPLHTRGINTNIQPAFAPTSDED